MAEDDLYDPDQPNVADLAEPLTLQMVAETVLSQSRIIQRQRELIEVLWLKAYGKRWVPGHADTLDYITASLNVGRLDDSLTYGRPEGTEQRPPKRRELPPWPTDPDAFVSLNQVAGHLGVSASTIKRMVAQGAFPRPSATSKSRRGWRVREVLDWPGYSLEPRKARRRGAGG